MTLRTILALCALNISYILPQSTWASSIRLQSGIYAYSSMATNLECDSAGDDGCAHELLALELNLLLWFASLLAQNMSGQIF